MLVLSRKSGEEILIGKDISIVVNRISGDRVSIAIKAPNEVRILRGELSVNPEFEAELEEEPVSAIGGIFGLNLDLGDTAVPVLPR